QQAEGVEMGQAAVVEVFAQVIVVVVVHVHVHMDVEGTGPGLLQDVAHAAHDVVAPAVVVVAVKAVEARKKGGHRPAGRAGGLVGREVAQLGHTHFQRGGDVIEGGQVHGDLSVLVFGHAGLALADGRGQLVDGHLFLFAVIPDAFAGFVCYIHKNNPFRL